MPPEDIPEDKELSFPCPICICGNVTKKGDYWECNLCDFKKEEVKKDKE